MTVSAPRPAKTLLTPVDTLQFWLNSLQENKTSIDIATENKSKSILKILNRELWMTDT